MLEGLERILKNKRIKDSSCLEKRVNNYSRKDPLFLGALFHDIAKDDSFVRHNNFTYCPNHEELGSRKVRPILNKFNLSVKEKWKKYILF